MFILSVNFVCSQNFFELDTRPLKSLEPPLIFKIKNHLPKNPFIIDLAKEWVHRRHMHHQYLGRKNKISFNFSMFYVDAPLLLDILGKVALDHKTTKPEST